mgnify:CR=1 FL=1
MTEYYYTDANRKPAGPLPHDELKAMHERGELVGGALIAEVGSDTWQEAAAFFGNEPEDAAERPEHVSSPPVRPTGAIGGPNEEFLPIAGWAFGLGIASWVCAGILAGIPAVITGHMALGRIKREGNTNGTAKVLATIGLVAGYLSIAATVLMVVVWILMIAFAAVASGSGP